MAGASVAAAQAGDPDCGTEFTCCTGTYALCTSAPCEPIARKGEHDEELPVEEVLCECVVADGPSVGTSACDSRHQGDGFLLSTYSFEQLEPPTSYRTMTCPVTAPGANCLDAPCVVDASDSSKAWCTCGLEVPDESVPPWVTLGGDCDTATCEETIWSGATQNEMQEASEALADYMGLSESPVVFCNQPSEGP